MQPNETIKLPPPLIIHEQRSEEVQEIITAVPKWIVRWGITLVFAILAGIIIAAALIDYPDVVKTTLKVNSLNAPKTILARQGGKLTELLVKDGETVTNGQVLGYLESIAKPEDVLNLSAVLKTIQSELSANRPISFLPTNLNLGEIQAAYQGFYQEFLQYQATQKNGYYLSRKAFLQKELQNVNVLRSQILKQKEIQKKEYLNAEEEYQAYQKLYQKKVISRSEFAQQENKFLAAKYPMQQSETALLNNADGFSAKEKELLELDHAITEQQAKFLQALNQCVNETESWILQHVIKSPLNGKLSYAGIVQQNQNVTTNQELFVVNPGNTDFFGEVQIPQYNMGKINLGEKTLIKLRSYPFEQYGMIRGSLTYVSEVAYRDSVFVAKVSFDRFENKDPNRKIILKNGMQADAEIITEESSLLQRFFRNVTKIMNER